MQIFGTAHHSPPKGLQTPRNQQPAAQLMQSQGASRHRQEDSSSEHPPQGHRCSVCSPCCPALAGADGGLACCPSHLACHWLGHAGQQQGRPVQGHIAEAALDAPPCPPPQQSSPSASCQTGSAPTTPAGPCSMHSVSQCVPSSDCSTCRPSALSALTYSSGCPVLPAGADAAGKALNRLHVQATSAVLQHTTGMKASHHKFLWL